MNDYAEPLINLKRVTNQIEDTLMKRPNADIESMLKEAESCVGLIREWAKSNDAS